MLMELIVCEQECVQSIQVCSYNTLRSPYGHNTKDARSSELDAASDSGASTILIEDHPRSTVLKGHGIVMTKSS